MPSLGQLRAGRSSPAPWALGFVLFALSCLIAARPVLALTSVGTPSDRIFRPSAIDQTLGAASLPQSATSSEHRRVEKKPDTQTPLFAEAEALPETPRLGRSLVLGDAKPAQSSRAALRARGPPRV